MAFPIILINSATGSDTAASGAGPATALTGSSASTSGDGLTVTLDGSPDLSGVATDGSHVIFLSDTTAGARNFGKITAADNGAKTVTVANAFGLTLSGKSWAIGGKRASLLSTTSYKLCDNNGGNGDVMPGWILEMESGHSETRSSEMNCRRAGDATDGPITLRGTSGAATRPLITFTNNGNGIIPRNNYWVFKDFELQNNNATKTTSYAFTALANWNLIQNIKCADSTNKFAAFFYSSGTAQYRIQDCNIQNCTGAAIRAAASTTSLSLVNNLIANNGSDGFQIVGNQDVQQLHVIGNIFAYNASNGIATPSMTNNSIVFNWLIRGNTFHGNGSDGIDMPQTSSQGAVFDRLTIENNEFSFNGGYGISFGGSGITDNYLASKRVAIRNNGFYGNTSGKYYPTTLTMSENEVITDPSSGGSATKDYTGATGGTNFMSSVHKALGYPIGGTLAVGTASSSYNYQDIGLQHQDAGGGGGLLTLGGMTAGMQRS